MVNGVDTILQSSVSTAYRAKIKNEWSYTSVQLCTFMAFTGTIYFSLFNPVSSVVTVDPTYSSIQ